MFSGVEGPQGGCRGLAWGIHEDPAAGPEGEGGGGCVGVVGGWRAPSGALCSPPPLPSPQGMHWKAAVGRVWNHHCRSSRACPKAFLAYSVLHWTRGGGTPPPRSRAPSLCPATVPLTPSASLTGVCNRQ